MKHSERIRKSMDDAEAGLAISWPIDQWADDFAQLEEENEVLKADKRLLLHVVHGRAMASSLPKHLKEE